MENLIMVCCGLGTNSTAILLGLYDRGIRPDFIVFADTGAERPKTYAHLIEVNAWLKSIDWPQIHTVKAVNRKGDIYTLEEDCLRRKALPSIAYGFKTCSLRWKAAPQEKYMNNNELAKKHWKSGGKITKIIGYDADEPGRAKDYSCEKYSVEYPLIEWDWTRDDCIERIDQSDDLNRPGKSSCFFCPSSKQSEIRSLKETDENLIIRALNIEDNAELTMAKGLGRSFSWRGLLSTDEMFPESFIEIDCGCYDGS